MSAETTRHVVLVRHAKAESNDVDDHEHPLAEHGRKQAPDAGRWIAGSGVPLDLALCSTAGRCRETWKLIADELSQRPRAVYEERLYEASLGELIGLLNEVDDQVGGVAVIGHNPGLHSLADALTAEAEGDLLAQMNRSGLPTAAVAVLTFTGSWKDVEHGVGKLTAYWTPHA
ncbi:SixA phosphatase family protein [Streptomyces sp. SP18CS02]|uniref:SixA phosphatase family protein n=1 Tax=Streptomyces sp. SP18CS02 TaxID=3002531 RepID=UPI002E787F16|nr:histidine phosphatase family protein [Streptomyces sp. SP18CS02]MEE1751154.1 histidine phosphatase family protein [Streptomyces sp. SP18CS02]